MNGDRGPICHCAVRIVADHLRDAVGHGGGAVDSENE